MLGPRSTARVVHLEFQDRGRVVLRDEGLIVINGPEGGCRGHPGQFRPAWRNADWSNGSANARYGPLGPSTRAASRGIARAVESSQPAIRASLSGPGVAAPPCGG